MPSNPAPLYTKPPTKGLPSLAPPLPGVSTSPNKGDPQPDPGSTPGLPPDMGIPSGEGPGGFLNNGSSPPLTPILDKGVGLKQNSAAADATAQGDQGPLVSGDATVSGQLGTLLKKDSPLYDIAEGDTLQRMNERGVANSSMAIGEQELARTRVALDVAKQDAGTFAASDLSKQGFGQDTALSEQRFGHETALSLQDFNQRSDLLTQEWDSKFGFNMQEHTNRVAEINVALEADLEKIAKNGEVQKDIDSNRYTEVLGGQFLNSVTERQKAMSTEIEAIYQTEGLTTTQQNAAITKALSRYEDDLFLLGGYYSQSPTWDNNWASDFGVGDTVPPGSSPGQPPPPASGGGAVSGTPVVPTPPAPPPPTNSGGGNSGRPPGSWWSQEEGDWVTQ